MVNTSGRNPFRISDPTQKISAFPSPFTRKADLDVENTCFSTLAPGSDSISHEDFTLVAGSVGPDNQAWITNWIYSTGDNMDSRRVSYIPQGHIGSTWKKSPSPTGSSSSSAHTYADDAYSVDPSSTGFETLDLTSVSSPDTGRSFVLPESVIGSSFRTPIDDNRVSQEHMTETFSVFPDDEMSAFAQHSHMMFPNSDILDSQSLAATFTDYADPSLDLKLDIPVSAAGVTSLRGRIDTHGQYRSQYHGQALAHSPSEHFNPTMVPSPDFISHQDALANGLSVDNIPWVSNSSVSMSDSPQDHLTDLSHFDFPPAGPQPEGMISFFRTDMERKMPLRIAPRPPHSEDKPDYASMGDAEEHKSHPSKTKKNQLPRTDPLYQARPDKEGYYRCPYIGVGGEKNCTEEKHKPTKQKCTYDKYLDAHIKPYRCKQIGCENESFSSNAVLGRHLREMHERSTSPLCRFKDCKRGQPGAGFRRSYNCWDHERRVHKIDVPYTGTDKPTTRKRKGTKARQGVAMKKTCSSQSALTTKSDPENRSSGFTEAPEVVPRRQSFPSEETVRTPKAYPDLPDQDAFQYTLEENSFEHDEWLSAYYAAEMDDEDDY